MAANYHNERIFVGTVFSRPKQGGEFLRNSETGYDRSHSNTPATSPESPRNISTPSSPQDLRKQALIEESLRVQQFGQQIDDDVLNFERNFEKRDSSEKI